MPTQGLRAIRISTDARLSDRYLTVQIKEPPSQEHAEAGRICALVEIEGSWQSNAQVGQTIINTVARHYYRAGASDPLLNFETALKRVNETLTAASHTGNTDWIGHVNAAVVLLVGDAVHIAASGQVTATLLRDDHGSPMLDGDEPPAAPGKVFGTVLSGTVEPADRLLIASSGLSQLLTPVEIEHTLAAPTPAEAVSGLSSLLAAKRGGWVNCLYIDAAAELLPDAVVDHGGGLGGVRSQIDRFIGTAKRYVVPAKRAGTASASDTVAAAPKLDAAALLEQAKAWTQAKSHHVRTTVIPAVGKHARAGKAAAADLIRQLKERRAAAPMPPAKDEPENLIGKPVFAIRDYAGLADEPESTGSGPVITDYTAAPPAPAAEPWHRRLLGAAKAQTNSAARRIDWRSVGFGLVALVLLVILISNLRVITRQRSTEQSRQTLGVELQTLADKLEEARLARVFNQPDKAQAALKTVLDGLPALRNTVVEREAAELQTKATGELDALTKTTRLTNLTEVASIPDAARLAVFGDNAAVVGKNGTSLTVVPLGGGTPRTVDLGGRRIAAVAALDDAAAILTDTGLATVAADGTLTAVDAGGTARTGTGLAAFLGNLYVLDTAGTQIWKYSSTKTGFGAADAYLADSTDVADAVDLAIDGQVYVLSRDGTVTRLNRGKADSFALGGAPAPTSELTAPKRLLTTTDSNTLFLLDGGRMLAYAKSGQFSGQYAFDDLTDIDDAAVDEPHKTAYILASGKLLKASF